MRKEWKTMLDTIATTHTAPKTGIEKYAYRPEAAAWQANASKPAGFSLEQVAALVMIRS